MSMYPRVNFEMSEPDLAALMEAFKPVPYIIVGGMPPQSQQENANIAWAVLGQKMGFDAMSVQPIAGMGTRHFTAIPSETPEQRIEREARESQQKRASEMAQINREIDALSERLDALLKEDA